MNSKGFTLIELMLYVAIASLMLSAIVFSVSLVLESRVRQQTVNEVEGQALTVMQFMARAIRDAKTISTPAIGIGGSTLTITTSAGTVTFDVTNNVLQMSENGAVHPLTNNRVVVSELTFTNASRVDTPGIVRVSFTLTYKNPESRSEYDYTKTFYTSASLRPQTP